MPAANEIQAEATKWAKMVSEKVTYPVNGVGQLIAALGGEGKEELEIGEHNITIQQITTMAPEGFFPVESYQDLLARIAYLMTRGQPPEELPQGEQLKELPAGAGQPPQWGTEPRLSEFPGVRGHGKRHQ